MRDLQPVTSHLLPSILPTNFPGAITPRLKEQLRPLNIDYTLYLKAHRRGGGGTTPHIPNYQLLQQCRPVLLSRDNKTVTLAVAFLSDKGVERCEKQFEIHTLSLKEKAPALAHLYTLASQKQSFFLETHDDGVQVSYPLSRSEVAMLMNHSLFFEKLFDSPLSKPSNSYAYELQEVNIDDIKMLILLLKGEQSIDISNCIPLYLLASRFLFLELEYKLAEYILKHVCNKERHHDLDETQFEPEGEYDILFNLLEDASRSVASYSSGQSSWYSYLHSLWRKVQNHPNMKKMIQRTCLKVLESHDTRHQMTLPAFLSTEQIPELLPRIRAVQSLKIENRSDIDILLKVLATANLTKLRSLDLSKCHSLTDVGVDCIKSFSLKNLNLSKCENINYESLLDWIKPETSLTTGSWLIGSRFTIGSSLDTLNGEG